MFTQQHCPQRLDAYTMLDSIVYHTDEQTLKRYFTINGASAETLQRDSSQIAIALLEELKADTQMKDCKDHKINFDYLYRIKGNDAIALQITLSAHLYSKH